MKSNASSADRTLVRKAGIGSLIAAAVFLFNPCINIVDLLPDFFGYLLLLKALTAWADLCPALTDALALLSKLRWLTLLKMFMMLLVPLVDDNWVLVFTFSFAVVELILLIPAIGKLFDGADFLSMRFNGRAVLMNVKNIRQLTLIFTVLKRVCNVLPEFGSLSSFEYSGYVTGGVQIDYGSYKNAYVMIGFIITLLVGILWLVNIIPYFSRIGRETAFLERFDAAYRNEVAVNTGLFIRRGLRTVITLLIAAFAFLPNLWMDEFNVIPTFVGAAFLLTAVVRFRKLPHAEVSRAFFIGSIVFAAVSATAFFVSVWFTTSYGLNRVPYDFNAYTLYQVTLILAVAEAAAMGFCYFCLYRALTALVKTEFAPAKTATDRRMLDIAQTQTKENLRRFTAGAVGFVIVFILNLVMSLTRLTMPAAAWIVPFLASLIWIVYMISTLNQFYDQIEYKYL